MIQKLREILLTKYIGSILVALIACNAVATLVTSAARALSWVVIDQSKRSVFGSSHSPYPWGDLVYSALTIALYLLAAYGLARWLYPADPPPVPLVGGEGGPSQDQSGTP